ncbi:Alpha/Beta hydrolase protein, partial [Entophlyctis helioformis]
GPGRSIDTDKYHVICTNVIGGCYGSTGPRSIDPADGKPYATRFPVLTIFDMVRAQFKMLDAMGITRLHASVGSSMGGMQSLAAAAMFPERVGKLITISAAARSHPYSIAMRYAQRQVLMADPNWNRGFYYSGVFPHIGMKLARQIATVTYRSGPEWEQRFGRKRSNPDVPPGFCADFLIETYLDHQGERFCLTYDPNSLLYISKAMDMFDMSDLASLIDQSAARTSSGRQALPQGVCSSAKQTHIAAVTESDGHDTAELNCQDSINALVHSLRNVQMPTLVLGAQSDILFPIWQQKEIASCLKKAGNKNVTYYELDALYGHDTFLVDQVNVGSAVKGHLEIA